MDPREAKMEEMERMLVDYQEKLESVTTNYEDKVHILEKRLVDTEMEQPPERRRDSGGNAGLVHLTLMNSCSIKFISRHKNQLKRFLLRVSFISDMLDSMDSLVDRNESPSEPFPGYVPQTAPAKTALPPNGKIFIKFLYSKDNFSSFITDFVYNLFHIFRKQTTWISN